MNYLAHIYLSGDNDLLKIGNFMADGIRGKAFENYPSEIRKGILLHRAIDTFTDAHPVFRQSTKRLHPSFHHYSGVIVDVFYDHFLSKNWMKYSKISLFDFVSLFYQSLHNNYDVLTPKTQALMPYMITNNWLVSYQTIDGIEKILTQMDNRLKNSSGMRHAIPHLKENYEAFENEFTLFFDEVITFVAIELLDF